jgi:hypothetical protein
MAPPLAPTPPPLDAATIGKLIREELDRDNKTLEFVQGQIDKDRSFYKHLYTIAGAFLAFMVAVAGISQYTSITQMRADMKISVDAELERDKAEIAALRAQAQTTVNTELQNVHGEVQKRVDTEFKSENITALVAKAAKERTATEITGVITKAVEDETRLAVRNLAPTIKDIATQQSQLTAHNNLGPVQFKLEQYGQLIDVDTLAALARSGDRKAFDRLDLLSSSSLSPSGLPGSSGYALESQTAKRIAAATTSAIILERYAVRSPPFSQPKTLEHLKNILISSPDVCERLTAIDSLPDDPTVLPTLVHIIANDDSIDVVLVALRSFNQRTHQNFKYTNHAAQLMTWWNQSSASFLKR